MVKLLSFKQSQTMTEETKPHPHQSNLSHLIHLIHLPHLIHL
jgi:hypothetical protein